MKTFLSVLLACCVLLTQPGCAYAFTPVLSEEETPADTKKETSALTLATPSAILMESSTGTILY